MRQLARTREMVNLMVGDLTVSTSRGRETGENRESTSRGRETGENRDSSWWALCLGLPVFDEGRQSHPVYIKSSRNLTL